MAAGTTVEQTLASVKLFATYAVQDLSKARTDDPNNVHLALGQCALSHIMAAIVELEHAQDAQLDAEYQEMNIDEMEMEEDEAIGAWTLDNFVAGGHSMIPNYADIETGNPNW